MTSQPGSHETGGQDLLDGLVLEDKHAWSFNLTLAAFIAAGVERMAGFGNGYPPELTFDEWQRILGEIVVGFRRYAEAEAKGDESDPAELNKSFDLLREWFPHLWD